MDWELQQELEDLQFEAEWELVSVKCSKCGKRDYEENMVPLTYTWSDKFFCVDCETLRRKGGN